MGSRNKTFILSESGHIAGIVNPPVEEEIRPLHQRRPVRRPRTGGRRGVPRGLLVAALGGLAGARSGKQVPARIPGEAGYPVLAAAPGTYVLEKAAG
jgi:polyhydroxyalkanoate synthase